jgi:hypothetical protein
MNNHGKQRVNFTRPPFPVPGAVRPVTFDDGRVCATRLTSRWPRLAVCGGLMIKAAEVGAGEGDLAEPERQAHTVLRADDLLGRRWSRLRWSPASARACPTVCRLKIPRSIAATNWVDRIAKIGFLRPRRRGPRPT